MPQIVCECGCGKSKEVRQADINRGWGKYFSKSCKAKAQERRTGQNKAYIERQIDNDNEGYEGHIMQSGYFGHGQE